jgi:hypothetical protein
MWVCAQARHAQLACPSGVPSPFFFYFGFSLFFASSWDTGLVGNDFMELWRFLLLSWIDQDWFRIVAGRTIHRKLGLVRGKRGF